MNIKNKLLLIIVFCIFSTLLINAQSEEEIIKATSNEKYWKRHFFDICLMGGPSLGTSLINGTSPIPSSDCYFVPINIGGSIGASFGYQYAFTDKFAFGPGFSAFCSIMSDVSYHIVYYTTTNYTIITHTRPQGIIIGAFNGMTLMCMFMFGDLKEKKIAFLLDTGIGLTASIKFGLYYKGFIFKIGYAFTHVPWDNGYFKAICYGHHITFDVGYKFNWKNKFEGKLLKK